MEEIFNRVALIFLGVLLGALFSIWRERRRDREAREHSVVTSKEGRKRDFRIAIASLLNGVLAEKDVGLFADHQRSLPRFREECTKVEPDVSSVEDFKIARDEYLGFLLADIECRDQNEKPPPLTDKFGVYDPAVGLTWKPTPDYATGRARIKAILKRIIQSAN